MSDKDLESTDSGEFRFTEPTNPCTMTFCDEDGQVGHLSWKDGVFKFDGDADAAAKIFFDKLMRQVENG